MRLPTNQPPQPVDALDLGQLEKRFLDSTRKLSGMVKATAQARTVLDYSGERRKRILAIAMSGALVAGEGVSKSEASARASDIYGEELDKYQSQDQAAQEVIEEYRAEQCKWEACRTLISLHKQLAGNL